MNSSAQNMHEAAVHQPFLDSWLIFCVSDYASKSRDFDIKAGHKSLEFRLKKMFDTTPPFKW